MAISPISPGTAIPTLQPLDRPWGAMVPPGLGGRRAIAAALLGLLLSVALWALPGMAPAQAALTDDRFDGNIFALYAGNGSLVPPRTTLADNFARQRPAIVVYYVDDSSDCKQFSSTVSRLQAFYGRAAEILPISPDALLPEKKDDPTDPAHYYRGFVPQTVIFDQNGQVVLDEIGQVPYEKLDDRLREVFDLVPRQESPELRLRSFNELNSELVPGS